MTDNLSQYNSGCGYELVTLCPGDNAHENHRQDKEQDQSSQNSNEHVHYHMKLPLCNSEHE